MAWDPKLPLPIAKTRWLGMSADSVYKELEVGVWQRDSIINSYNEELERALLARKDRLLHLGLAQFGGSSKVAKALYNDASNPDGDAEYKLAIRAAVLRNQKHPDEIFVDNDGYGVIDAQELSRIMREGDWAEQESILRNPGGRKLITRLFLREAPFDQIEFERYQMFLRTVYSNPGLTINEDSVDGPDFKSWDLQKALFKMIGTIEANHNSLLSIWWILKNINPSDACTPKEDPRPVFDRWKRLEVGKDLEATEYTSHTQLNMRDKFVIWLASLYGRTYKDNKSTQLGSLDDSDQVMRCCFYGHNIPKGKDLEAAFNRDDDVFIFALRQNASMPYSREARALIERPMRGHSMHRLYEKRMKQAKVRRPNLDTSPIDENYESEASDPGDSQEMRLLKEEMQLLRVIQAQVASGAKEQLNIWKYTMWLVVVSASIVVYLIRGHLF